MTSRNVPIVVINGPLAAGKSSILEILQTRNKGVVVIPEPVVFCQEQFGFDLDEYLLGASLSQIVSIIRRIDQERLNAIREAQEDLATKVIFVDKTLEGMLASGIGRKISQTFQREAIEPAGSLLLKDTESFPLLLSEDNGERLKPDISILLWRDRSARRQGLLKRDHDKDKLHLKTGANGLYDIFF